MKKKLLGLTALAAVGALFLASCTPTQGEGRTSSNSTTISDAPTTLPYAPTGSLSDTSISSFGSLISSSTGATVAFNLGDDLTSDWTNILSTTQTVIRLSTMDYLPSGTFLSNIYEASATGSDAATSAGYDSSTFYKIFESDACYVTIVFETDGSIEFFKDGTLMLTFDADTVMNDYNADDDTTDDGTVGDVCAAFLSDLSSGGMTVNSASGCTITNLYVDEAMSDDEVATLYDEKN